VLILIVGGIGGFVAKQYLTQKPMPRHPGLPVAAEQATQAATSTATQTAATTFAGADGSIPDSTDIAANTVKSAGAAPAHDRQQILAHIAETPGTYMTDMIGDLSGHLVRWPDRRQDGLRIWVQAGNALPDWEPGYAQMARDAFDDWGRDSELPMRFDFVLDSASSDIHIVWANRFAPTLGQRVGATRRTTDQFGWIVGAEIEVAIHDSTGKAIPAAALAGIVRHEAGHALGLGHSKDPRTKMFPTEMRSDISPADRSTLRLLYELPPGLAR
jgi:hypothetical protein